jgi:hypothetical protein
MESYPGSRWRGIVHIPFCSRRWVGRPNWRAGFQRGLTFNVTYQLWRRGSWTVRRPGEGDKAAESRRGATRDWT